MRCLRGLAALALLSVVPLFAQDTPTPQSTNSGARNLVLEGTRLLTGGDTNAALENFRKAHNLVPTDVEAIIGLARAESLHTNSSGKSDLMAQAQADYETALKLHPTAELFAELASALLYNGNDYRAAISASRKALDLNPGLMSAEMAYGNALVAIGDFDDAINVYSKACAQSHSAHPKANGTCGVWSLYPFLPGTTASIASERGWAYLEKSRTELANSKKVDCTNLALAERDFAEAVSLAPADPDLRFRLASVLTAEGLSNISNCARSEPERKSILDRAWSQSSIAVNLDGTNALYRDEFVSLSEVLKRKPEYNGGTAREVGRDEDPIVGLREAIRRDPTDGFAWGNLGKAYLNSEDYKNAEEATKKAVEIFTERFKNAKPPTIDDMMHGRDFDEERTNVSMLASSYGQLAIICNKLHKKREARRYQDAELRAFDVLRMMPSASQSPAANPRVELQPGIGTPRPAQPPSPSPPPRHALIQSPPPQCQLPVHELCQYPNFRPQPYDPNNPQPYTAPDTRDYDRCVLGNQREDARYQQCVQQRQWEQQRERQDH